MSQSIRTLLLLFCALVAVHPGLSAQEKAKSEEPEKKPEPKKEATQLRVQIVFADYEGEKKINSLPYTLLLDAPDGHRGDKSSIRMGLRVPVATGSFTSGSSGTASPVVNTQFTYIDIGSNLDGWASREENGRFSLHLILERSSAYTSGEKEKATAVTANQVLSSQPVVQSFRTEVELLMRDGQTVQSTLATDPVSGRVTKVEVTISALK
jgi:hypothetical protein